MNALFRKKGYIIFKHRNGYVIHNTNKPFDNGHTHFNSYSASKRLITRAIFKKVPTSVSNYYLTSLQRISKDKVYITKLEQQKQANKRKKQKPNYRNDKGKRKRK